MNFAQFIEAKFLTRREDHASPCAFLHKPREVVTELILYILRCHAVQDEKGFKADLESMDMLPSPLGNGGASEASRLRKIAPQVQRKTREAWDLRASIATTAACRILPYSPIPLLNGPFARSAGDRDWSRPKSAKSVFHFADFNTRIALADEKMTLGICGSQ
jgi:hypothetical protein